MATGTDVDGRLRPETSVEGGSNSANVSVSKQGREKWYHTLIGVFQQFDCLRQLSTSVVSRLISLLKLFGYQIPVLPLLLQ